KQDLAARVAFSTPHAAHFEQLEAHRLFFAGRLAPVPDHTLVVDGERSDQATFDDTCPGKIIDVGVVRIILHLDEVLAEIEQEGNAFVDKPAAHGAWQGGAGHECPTVHGGRHENPA